jgi:hypothetical protein
MSAKERVMSSEKNSRRYKFYLAFNNISLGAVFLLPLIVASIYITTDSPYGCDQTNTVLTWILIFTMNAVNFKQTLEIFEKNNLLKDDKDES